MPRLLRGHSFARLSLSVPALVFGSIVISDVHTQEGVIAQKEATLGRHGDIDPPGNPTPTATAVFSSGNLAVPIQDNSTLSSSLSAAGLPGTVYDVNVDLRLSHSFDGDLRIRLTAPSGVAVPFVINVGGSGNDFGSGATDCSGTQTRFDDEAATPIDAGAPPFAGTFRPSRGLGALDGSSANGLWTLTITDEATDDSGTLWCWDLTITALSSRGQLIGDSRSDYSVWRPSNATWFARALGAPAFSTLPKGQSGDIPVLGAFGAASTNRRGTFRPSTGVWSIDGLTDVVWGVSGDIPVPADYDGNSVTDIAIWRPSAGVWFVKDIGTVVWGTSGDVPVPADYVGLGASTLAVWRPSNGAWFITGFSPITFGSLGDIPVPADYFGDQRAEVAVFRPSEGVWYIQGWDGEARAYPFGVNGDIPVPADYDGDGKADIAVWRPSDGRWYVRNLAIVPFGANGDIPGTKRPSYPTYPY